MLIAYRQIKGAVLEGIDETVGQIDDLLFDDEMWILRHVVADTGLWWPGRKVLIPPDVFVNCDWDASVVKLPLTRQQVKESPDVDAHKPVSRQKDLELFQHYQIPVYWGPSGARLAGSPNLDSSSQGVRPQSEKSPDNEPSNLRSANSVRGYYIHATDGDIGHVEDFIVDDHSWVIRYLAVDTINWFPARKVLVSPHWIESISWADATVCINLTRSEIKGSPEYDPSQPINRAAEEQLYDYYQRPRYWLP
jgi:hypothetical protein